MNMKPNTFNFRFAFILFFCLLSVRVSGDLPKAEEAPMNPYFVQFLRDIDRGTVPHTISDDGFSLGERPAPVDLSHARNVRSQNLVDSYPLAYDLRPLDKLTAVKNQGNCGSCWTFATMASLESYGKPVNNWNSDLSG